TIYAYATCRFHFFPLTGLLCILLVACLRKFIGISICENGELRQIHTSSGIRRHPAPDDIEGGSKFAMEVECTDTSNAAETVHQSD
uniref:Uncharacterized protein n=1 Tax=Romanomermis culicivorax TaxID=13658 RepID=A0A915HH69_ROMCU